MSDVIQALRSAILASNIRGKEVEDDVIDTDTCHYILELVGEDSVDVDGISSFLIAFNISRNWNKRELKCVCEHFLHSLREICATGTFTNVVTQSKMTAAGKISKATGKSPTIFNFSAQTIKSEDTNDNFEVVNIRFSECLKALTSVLLENNCEYSEDDMSEDIINYFFTQLADMHDRIDIIDFISARFPAVAEIDIVISEIVKIAKIYKYGEEKDFTTTVEIDSLTNPPTLQEALEIGQSSKQQIITKLRNKEINPEKALIEELMKTDPELNSLKSLRDDIVPGVSEDLILYILVEVEKCNLEATCAYFLDQDFTSKEFLEQLKRRKESWVTERFCTLLYSTVLCCFFLYFTTVLSARLLLQL